MGLDHYKDHTSQRLLAQHSGDTDIILAFSWAHKFLLLNAIVLLATLASSGIKTIILTAIFVIPALLWNTPIGTYGLSRRTLIIKRIPGLKAVLVGVIRGCGTFLVVRSVLPNPSIQWQGQWSPMQIVVWTTLNRTCHAVSSLFSVWSSQYLILR